MYSTHFLVHLFPLNLKYKEKIAVIFRKSNCLSCYFAILLPIMGTYNNGPPIFNVNFTVTPVESERLHGTTFNQQSASKTVYCWK
jgi:hypothetical protein